MTRVGWKLIQLGDIAEIRGGSAFPLRFQGRSSGAFPFYKVSDMSSVGNEFVLSNANNWVTSDDVKALGAKPFPEGTVVFPKVGAALFTNKKRLLSCAALVDNNVMGVTPDPDKCLVEFLHFWFLSIDLKDLANPGPLPSINGARVKGTMIPLPSIAEQSAIVDILRAAKNALLACQSELSLERERKAALMEHLFTFGAAANGRRVEIRKHGRVPADWSTMRLEQCAVIQTGVAKGRRLGDGSTVSVPYLRVANVQDGYLNLVEMKTIEIRRPELERYQLQVGDVVLTEGGDFDKLGRGFVWRGEVAPCVHQNHVFAVRANPQFLTPEFLAYLVQSPYGRSYFLTVAHKTTNLACINKTKLGNFPVLLPSLDEQADIVKVLSACDATMSALTVKSKYLNECFDALLQRLISGRLDAIPSEIGREANA